MKCFVGKVDDVLGRIRFLRIRRSRSRYIYSVVTAFFYSVESRNYVINRF